MRFEVSFGVLAPDLGCSPPIRDDEHPAREGGRPGRRVGHPDRERRHHLLGRRERMGPNGGVRSLEDPWVAPPDDAFERTAPPEARPSRARGGRRHLRARRARGARRRDGDAPRPDPPARRAGRLLRLRPRRHDREPPGGHPEPRALRGARRARDRPRASGARGPDPGARCRAPQAALERRWADLVYDGQWFSPLRTAIDAYVDATQPRVTGDVRLRFELGLVYGRRAPQRPYSLYDLSLATYGAAARSTSPTPRLRAPLSGLPLKVWSARQGTGS